MGMFLFNLLLTAFCVWAVTTGSGPELGYGRLTWAALAAWFVLLRCWLGLWKRLYSAPPGAVARAVGCLIDCVFTLAPALIVIAYGALAPAAPSLTAGGVDVCQYETGFCVSGTRSFIGFGIFMLVVELIFAGCIIVAACSRRR